MLQRAVNDGVEPVEVDEDDFDDYEPVRSEEQVRNKTGKRTFAGQLPVRKLHQHRACAC